MRVEKNLSVLAALAPLFALVLTALTLPAVTQAQDLATVKPVVACEHLAKTDFTSVADAPVVITSAAIVRTVKGPFCEVKGSIAPAIGFVVSLPVEHWTQRYLEVGCGGLCGSIRAQVEHASGFIPALNGELVVASDNLGHDNTNGGPMDATFASDPQKLIDFAYRGNHQTTVVTKALIKAFYGQPQRFAYFMGCSDGGREALMEAQRYPDDFDGISAGATAGMFAVQNAFYHVWNTVSDRRANGSYILPDAKVQMLHKAVLATCDTLSGVDDGVLQDPRACKFDPAVLQCAKGAADQAGCLTGEELATVRKLYNGAQDGQGHTFTFGVAPGSELTWHLPTASLQPLAPSNEPMMQGDDAKLVHDMMLDDPTPSDATLEGFSFSQHQFDRVSVRAPLFNAMNTNLKAFAAHGGKLIMYHGWSDTSVTPGVSIAYYQGVQKYLGVAQTDAFLRLFLIPGMSHCAGGEGNDQFDLLSALMAWTEKGQAPDKLITAKAPVPPGGPPSMQQMMKMIHAPANPYASPPEDYAAARPVYPFPYIARYSGKGDAKDAANYQPALSPAGMATAAPVPALGLIGPDNQKAYQVRNGRLVVITP